MYAGTINGAFCTGPTYKSPPTTVNKLRYLPILLYHNI